MAVRAENITGLDMSLSKQLLIGFFAVLFVSFTSVLWMNIENTRDYIQKQLTSHAQDTATSLGLSLTPYIGQPEDLAIIETMTNAIFDRGYYLSINLIDNNDDVIISRKLTETNKNIPDWFVSAFPITPPTLHSEINDGWTIRGTLQVTSNPNYGYIQLWQIATNSLLIFTTSLCVTALVIYVFTSQIISKPLKRVIAQADAISHQQFEKITDIPKTLELLYIVTALNRMSDRLSLLFTNLVRQTELYRELAYVDKLTGFGNRRSFELCLNKWSSDKHNFTENYLFIVKAPSLTTINKTLGGELGDEYLLQLSRIIRNSLESNTSAFSIFRINGADFGIIVENSTHEIAERISQRIIKQSKKAEKTEHHKGFAYLSFGHMEPSVSTPSILSRLDNALTVASQTEKLWVNASENIEEMTISEWRTTFSQIKARGKVKFATQVIKNCKSEGELYTEYFARFPRHDNSDKDIPIRQLIPMSIKLDLAVDLDKLICENLFENAKTSIGRVGLNLSRFGTMDQAFNEWILEKIQSTQDIGKKLVIEIPERALIQDIQQLIWFVERLKKYQVKITVEHFGAQLASVSHIRKLKPDYLKIDGRYTSGIDINPDNQLFLSSMLSIAQQISTEVIIELVETKNEYEWLVGNNFGYLQGFYIAEPK